jgi:hypothetical protein
LITPRSNRTSSSETKKGDKSERQFEHGVGAARVITLHLGSLVNNQSDVVLSAFTPRIVGDKIGERLALADEAGIEPTLTIYSRPAFAKVRKGDDKKSLRQLLRFKRSNVVSAAFGPN